MNLPIIKFQKQAFRHKPEEGVLGDCWRTALACLLGIDRDDYPHSHNEDDLRPVVEGEIARRGLQTIKVGIAGALSVEEALTMAATWSEHPHMFVGFSRTGVNHVVIAHRGKIIHDPSLTDAGIVGPVDNDENGCYIVEWLVHFPAVLPEVAA